MTAWRAGQDSNSWDLSPHIRAFWAGNRAISLLKGTERIWGPDFLRSQNGATATDRRENHGFLKGNCLPGGQRNLGLARLYS